MARGQAPVAKRTKRTEGLDDEWVTVTWREEVDGKMENMSRTVRSKDLEQQSRKPYDQRVKRKR